jgi:hypothetical protein
MRYIGYVTRDDVNAALAQQAVLPADVKVVNSDSEGGLPSAPLLGLVYDLDHLPPADRRRVVDQLSEAPPAQPVIVHSYDLDDEQAADLRLQGVEVCRHLDEGIFQRLAGVPNEKQKAA